MRKKFSPLFLLGALAIFLFLPLVGSAQSADEGSIIGTECDDIWNFLGSPVDCTLGVFVGFVNSLLKLFLIVVSWAMEVVLQANQNLLNTPAVTIGFNISLAIANLGFVLAIVVIGIMTILRSQTYGMKKTLWKLIVAALLVNFSLVISGAIINFADQLTQYFIKAGGSTNFSGFVQGFASAFEPQKVSGSQQVALTADGVNAVKDAGTTGAIIAAVFAILFLIITIVVTLGFVVLLLIRYVALGFLVILMPFAWLLWIFPRTRRNWDRWWSSFLRWSFFAPISMFFIFLAMKTYAASSTFLDKGIVDTLLKNTQSAGISLGLGKTFTDFISVYIPNFINVVANNLIITGLMVGGLFAANKLSITGADTAYDGAKGAMTGFRDYMKKGGPVRTAARGAVKTAGFFAKPPVQAKTKVGKMMAAPFNVLRRRIHEAPGEKTVYKEKKGELGETLVTPTAEKTTAGKLAEFGKTYHKPVGEGGWIPEKHSMMGSMWRGFQTESGLFGGKKSAEKKKKEEEEKIKTKGREEERERARRAAEEGGTPTA